MILELDDVVKASIDAALAYAEEYMSLPHHEQTSQDLARLQESLQAIKTFVRAEVTDESLRAFISKTKHCQKC